MSGKLLFLVLLSLTFSAGVLVQDTEAQTRQTRTGTSNAKQVRFVPKHQKIKTAGRAKRAAISAQSDTPLANVNLASHSVESVFEEPSIHSPIGACACGSGCQSNCNAGWAGPVVYGRVEYLLWSTRGMDTPALVTTSFPGTLQEQAGVLDQPATTVLFGGSRLNDDVRNGGRFTIGLWADSSKWAGIEFTYLALEEENEFHEASNFDETIVARPFFNLTLNEEDSRLIAFPSLVSGNTTVSAASEFQTFDLVRRKPSVRNCGTEIDHFIGYRYAELKDNLRIAESTISLADPTTDTAFQLFDQFKTKSEFFGGVIGMRVRKQRSPNWSMEFMSKFALGNTRSRLGIEGATTTTTPNGAQSTRSGGVLTQDSNIGSYEDDEFSTFSELGISLHHRTQCGLICTVGYSFIYWSDVLRAGSQIDTTLNPTQIPPSQLVGEARPQVNLDYDSFYAQGLRLGFEFAY